MFLHFLSYVEWIKTMPIMGCLYFDKIHIYSIFNPMVKLIMKMSASIKLDILAVKELHYFTAFPKHSKHHMGERKYLTTLLLFIRSTFD